MGSSRFLSVLCSSALLISLALMVSGWVMDRQLMPKPKQLLPALQREPVQEPIEAKPFTQVENDHTYHVKPLYTYELYGLVVSKHEANSSFSNRAHEQWGDYLNTTDLCVVWGRNALGGIYQDIKFTSGQWTCFFEPKSGKNINWHDFDLTGIGNNHVLIGSKEIANKLKEIRIGDQIHFKGYLAEYGTSQRMIRGTSTTRTDTGQGACETVYVKSLEIIKPIPRYWRTLRQCAMWSSVVLFFLWVFFSLAPTDSKTNRNTRTERTRSNRSSKEQEKQPVTPVASEKYFIVRQGHPEKESGE